jgi:hypothetical protein
MNPKIATFFLFFVFTSSAFADYEVNFKKLLKSKWVEVSSPNFIVLTDEKPQNAAQYALELEEFRHFVSFYLGLEQKVSYEPPVFVLFKNMGMKKAIGMDKSFGGMFYSGGDKTFAVARSGDFKRNRMKPSFERHIVLHELVHYLDANAKKESVRPVWYREGIAEYLATFQINEDVISLGNPEYLRARFRAMSYHGSNRLKSVDIEQLFKSQNIGQRTANRYSREADAFYGRAFGTFHYLVSDPTNDNARSLDVYIHYLTKGDDVDSAFRKAFNRGFDELTAEVDAYLGGKSLYGLNYPRDVFKFPKVQASVEALSDTDAFFKLAPVLLRQYMVLDTKEKRDNVRKFIESNYGEDSRSAVLKELVRSRR